MGGHAAAIQRKERNNQCIKNWLRLVDNEMHFLPDIELDESVNLCFLVSGGQGYL